MSTLNETHDPGLKSWVESANAEGSDFPIQNLPFGVFRRKSTHEPFRGGVAIGAEILDLGAAHKAGLFSGEAAAAAANCSGAALNTFMAMGPSAWAALRLALSRALRAGNSHTDKLRGCLVQQAQARYAVPADIGDYTDFFTSIHHATNVGKLFRPDNPLLPNYKWVPIGYHGRGSSIGVSGQSFPRPQGQKMPPGAGEPVFGPSGRLDYELEIGIYIGVGNALGRPIPIAEAERHVFGLGLLNDWSARDIQAWEYQPLGPFLAKSFATTVSPWIVTLEALAPYRVEWTRPATDPQPLPYLDSSETRARGALDVQIETWLETAQMRGAGAPPTRLSHSSMKHAYWTIGQMVAHHTVNGCNLQPGDLFGSGTLSGPAAGEEGSLLELSIGGKQPVQLANGEARSFLEDGDCVILRAWCERGGYARIGFGECRGTVASPAGAAA
jgi:fumarylacetoacetase